MVFDLMVIMVNMTFRVIAINRKIDASKSYTFHQFLAHIFLKQLHLYS